MNSVSLQKILSQIEMQSFVSFSIYYQTLSLQALTFDSILSQMPKKKKCAKKIQGMPNIRKKIQCNNSLKKQLTNKLNTQRIATLEDFLIDLQTVETESFIDKFIIDPNETLAEKQQLPSVIEKPIYDRKFQMLLQEFQTSHHGNHIITTPFQTFGEDQEQQRNKIMYIQNPFDFSLSTSRAKFREHEKEYQQNYQDDLLIANKSNQYQQEYQQTSPNNNIIFQLLYGKNQESFSNQKNQRRTLKAQKKLCPLQDISNIQNNGICGRTIMNLKIDLSNFMDDLGQEGEVSCGGGKEQKYFNLLYEDEKQNYRNTIKFGV